VPVLIASLKVTAMVEPTAIPVAEFAGVVLLIVGGVTSGVMVVKLRTASAAKLFSATSSTPVLTQILYCVPAVSVPDGNVNVVLELVVEIVP
jgi:hypothetical protein